MRPSSQLSARRARRRLLEAVSGGTPRRVRRRAKNVLASRALGRAVVWRRLWR
jgi:hypothetical protein